MRPYLFYMTVGGKNLRIYEVMFITDPRIPEESREAAVEKVKKVIETRVAANIEKVDRWGIRKLAYKLPKTKLTEGDYTVIQFRCDGSNLGELNNLFTVTPEFVRKQIVRRTDIEKIERKEMLKARLEKAVDVEESVNETLSVDKIENSEKAEPEFEVEEK